MPKQALDRVLHLPIEFIITEVFYIIPRSEAKKKFEYQNYISQLSNDEDLINSQNFSGYFAEDVENKYGFCQQQITMTIIADALSILDEHLARLSAILADMGLMHV